MTSDIEVYLGLGSNIGDKKANIDKALLLLEERGVRIVILSDMIETEPWGFSTDSKFINCVVRAEVSESVTPIRLLGMCKDIECQMGRSDKPEYDAEGRRIYHSRLIDIDILLYGTQDFDYEDLVIPHPLMSARDFVMIPLRQVASQRVKEAFKEIFI